MATPGTKPYLTSWKNRQELLKPGKKPYIKGPVNTGKIQEPGVRDPVTGKFPPGVSGNPKGRPPGSQNMATKFKALLETLPDGEQESYEKLLLKRILKKAVVDGNDNTIKLIWNYMDGMPKQQNIHEHHVGDKTLQDLFDEAEAGEDEVDPLELAEDMRLNPHLYPHAENTTSENKGTA